MVNSKVKWKEIIGFLSDLNHDIIFEKDSKEKWKEALKSSFY